MNRLEILKEVYGECEWSESALTHLIKVMELTAKECIDKIETYRIPVGNSRSGELACEWTYNAPKEIRDDIKETFGVKE
jgi:hypothetical protein